MNKLLKDAIADAKAVRETALANAKLALEEAFQPKLQKMFSEKIKHEMEEEAPVEDDDSTMEASMDMENERMNEPQDEMARMKELAGLNEFEDDDDDFDDLPDLPDDEYDGSDDPDAFPVDDDEDTGYDDEEPIDEDLEEIIRQLAEDDMKDEMAPDLEEDLGLFEADDEEEKEKMEEDLDEEINLDEVIEALREGEGEDGEDVMEVQSKVDVNQIKAMVDKLMQPNVTEGVINEFQETAVDPLSLLPGVLTIIGGGAATIMGHSLVKGYLKKLTQSKDPKVAERANKVIAFFNGLASGCGMGEGVEVTEELNEAYSVIEHLREKINEVNLLNAKLLYVNKLFKKHSLSESEKVRVVETFDRATTVRETKLIYTTLSESLSTRAIKKTKVMTEGFASAPVKKTQILTESNSIVSRFQKLAGLTNEE